MGRRGGRARKGGERYPSGKLKPITEGLAPALGARIRAHILKFFADPKFATPFGILYAEGAFTHAQFAAGNRVGDIFRRYHRYKQLRDTPKSPSYEHGFGSSDLAEERMSAEQLEAFEGSIRAAEEAWRGVDAELAVVPRNVRQAVIDLCVFDTAVNPSLHGDIARFLDLLVRRWPERRERSRRKDRMPALRIRTPAAEKATLPIKRPDTITSALEKVVRKLRPDLDTNELRLVADTFHALRDREAQRRSKGTER
jgi:hypothetical protein